MALGHPKGLFALFFTEMWERLAFYTMVGILLLYVTDAERGGLGLPDAQGNEIYGLYLAFVYFTPFLGGMIADRYLGYRKAVFLGGLMMAAGLFLMGTPGFLPFTLGIIGLIVGNGFFKPNISVMVGNLYEPGDPKRDAGFNIFYMGINIGAFAATFYVAPIVRNVLGWLWTFRAAGIGLLISVIILSISWKSLAKADRTPESDPEDTSFGAVFGKILLPAFIVGAAGYFLAKAYLPPSIPLRPAVCGFLAGMIPVIIFFIRMGTTAKKEEKPGLLSLLPIYVAGGAFFMILHLNGSAMTQWARDDTDREVRGSNKAISLLNPWAEQEGLPDYYVNASESTLRPDPRSLLVVDEFWQPVALQTEELAAAEPETVEVEAAEAVAIESEVLAPPDVDPSTVARMYGQQRMDQEVVEFLTAAARDGLSVRSYEPQEAIPEQWAARAANVFEAGLVSVQTRRDSHGAPIITVEVPDDAQPISRVVFLRDIEDTTIATFLVDQSAITHIYDDYRERFGREPDLLPPGEFVPVINSEVYQSWNPIFVILLTPVVVAFFQWKVVRNKAVPTAHKLFYGMLMTTGALLLMALAGSMTDGGTMKVSGLWLAGFYMIVTVGELCLSPMGLSLVTKLSPKRLVGLTMGGWFMAVAFGNNLSGFLGGIQGSMSPVGFFLLLAGLAGLVALFILALLPKLDAAIKQYGA
ncbi:MAG: peptide MFS transporter [bacterium]|nr:peptide MFS transporter [bacterium]